MYLCIRVKVVTATDKYKRREKHAAREYSESRHFSKKPRGIFYKHLMRHLTNTLLNYFLGFIGFGAFCVILGEQAPDTSDAYYYGAKAVAWAIFLSVIFIAMLRERKGKREE